MPDAPLDFLLWWWIVDLSWLQNKIDLKDDVAIDGIGLCGAIFWYSKDAMDEFVSQASNIIILKGGWILRNGHSNL